MLSELRKYYMNKIRISTKRENTQKNQTGILELKNIITEQTNSLYGFWSRHDQVEERISELKDKPLKIIYSKEQ